MRRCARTCVCLYVFVACTFARVVDRTAAKDSRMHQALKQMLGFKRDSNMPHPVTIAEEAPKYMLDLYERFKDGPFQKGHLSGNTVRSIKGKPELVNGDAMFVFDLSSLASVEQMISAEIHLYKRRKNKYNKDADLELVMHEISPNYTIRNGEIHLNMAAYGWQWYDVTNQVKSCISERRVVPHSLGLNFELTKSSGNSNLLNLRRFMHHHSSPYLIIYSNDSISLDLDNLETISQQTHSKETTNKLASKDKVIPKRSNREKRSLSDNSADIPLYHSRARSMSILTNEIPEDPDDYRPYPININFQTHPGMLQTRKESRHRLTDSRLIPYPGEYHDKRRRKKSRNRKNKKGRRKNKLELPKEWDDLQSMAEEEHKGNLCSRKKLVIDFDDIGWGEWIISPKSFKAHYCSGTCPFPLTKKLRPSNHATIQSLVNAVGINPDVPAPCCVPDKLSSITLLYFDEDRNVVLKNYPNMTVQKCACR